jgi:formate dehydrogenase major subunit
MSSHINIKINHQELQVAQGETILNVCKKIGIEIPHLCHDPKLKPFSSCFVCVVEIKGYKNHQPACSTMVQEGMEVFTDSPRVHKSRKMALELLLSNHYADCVAPCKLTCPAGVDVQGYLSLIEKGLHCEAIALIKETNPLPAICGRVCVRPCEDKCRRQLTQDNKPVGIDYLKRFIADSDIASDTPYTPVVKPQNGKKVAIIGGGPAGLTAAYYLQIAGFQADIYERQPSAGGWLRYGIPEYRLPNAVLDKEVANITKLGVTIFCNHNIESTDRYAELDKNYDAIFLAIGAQDGDLLGIGEKPAPNLVSGIDFLKRNAETGNDTDLRGKKVVVVGGGNTAMDCCRSARRCGSTDVLVLYRRTEADMPANPIEIHESKIEGVNYEFLAAPVDVYYDDGGGHERVDYHPPLRGLKCIRMKAEKQPGSRRSNIVPIEGSEFDLPCDLVLPATGQKIQYNILDKINEYYKPHILQLNKWKTLDANETTYQMNIPKIFAAGDAVTGPTNIIQAIAGGKAAATYMEQFIFGQPFEFPVKPFVSTKDSFIRQEKEEYHDKFAPCKRYEMPVLDESERNNFNEVELGYQEPELIVQEAERCLECGCSAFYDCKLQQYATQYGAVQTRYKGDYQKFTVNYQHPQIE